jgi:hypothetical protein
MEMANRSDTEEADAASARKRATIALKSAKRQNEMSSIGFPYMRNRNPILESPYSNHYAV